MKIEIFDTTLRDGEQSAGVEFSADDKIRVIHALDALGVSYIETGMMTDDPARQAFFHSLAGQNLRNARLAVFGQTCRTGEAAAENSALRAIAACPVPTAVIYGKASLYQVTNVLKTTPEENLRMITDSIAFLKQSGEKEVLFDAEHFFDGYSDNAAYAMQVVDTAFAAGASRVILCDTNGGMLPDVIGMICAAVTKSHRSIGIHCHNDLGMAAACSVSAVLSGVTQVQGTISGIGERCGNANLNTILPVLQLKLGFDCIGDNIRALSRTARTINEAANMTFDEKEPFVGGYAFTHKAGTHIDGVAKAPRAFEHIPPEAVGNQRNIVVSGLSGRAAVIDKMRAYLPDQNFRKDDEAVVRTAARIREREAAGYAYEDAGASLALLMDEALGRRKRYFRLISLKVIVDSRADDADEPMGASAVIKIEVGGREELTAGEGNGPVNAIDEALRRALTRFYPEIANMRLTDYRVRVLDSKATASSVRVSIESTDGVSVWRTVGVSHDVINASWQAMCDAVEYMLGGREKS
ncbi:MAG: citramalate synthase [Eubacteriales bacterium]